MFRRVAVVLLCVCLLAVLLVPSVPSASAYDLTEQSFEEFVSFAEAGDYEIAPLLAASSNVSFTVKAFIDGGGAVGTSSVSGFNAHTVSNNLIPSSTLRDSSALYQSTVVAYASLLTMTYGLIVTIPPNSLSGYYTFVGFYPGFTWYTSGSNTWVYGTGVNSDFGLPQFCVIADTPDYTALNFTDAFTTQTVYVPAHSVTLYAIIGQNLSNYAPPATIASSYKVAAGGRVSPNAFVAFTPEESLADQTAVISQGFTDVINAISASGGSLSPLEEFEAAYLEKFDDQISGTEDFISPSNPVLPNNGDVAGFVNDISDGLGLSGSSFSASDFSDATSSFSGSAATGSGGPWEFFSQEVADSLAGGTSAAGLNDDDYIYAWMDEAMRRYSKWH